MGAYSKRAYPRIQNEGPIKFTHYRQGHYFDSRMYNSSKGGMYFEPDHALEPESKIYIVMVNYSPAAYGAEAYRCYKAIIRWCRQVSDKEASHYGVGVQFLEKSHEILDPDLQGLKRACDLCGVMVSDDDIHKTDDFVYLCPHCFKHLNAFPDGIIKENIERFLIGNVI